MIHFLQSHKNETTWWSKTLRIEIQLPGYLNIANPPRPNQHNPGCIFWIISKREGSILLLLLFFPLPDAYIFPRQAPGIRGKTRFITHCVFCISSH